MKNQKVRITKTVVESAAPKDREYIIWDSAIAGFGLRVRPTGAKSFVFTYRSPGGRAGKVRRVTIKADNPDRARREAKALAGQHHGGGDPAETKAEARRQAASPTVADVLDRFLADHVEPHLKAKTAHDYKRICNVIWKPRLGDLRIGDLATKHVAEAYHDLRATPTLAGQAVRILSSCMSLAEEWGLRPPGSNPARIRLRSARRRERLFSDGEVARLKKAIDKLEGDGAIGRSVALGLRLLFATGCRAGEVLSLEWQHVDLDQALMRWPDSKTGFLAKPITAEVKALLRKADRIVGVPWVCPSPTFKQMRLELLEAGFEAVMAEANVPANENATLHLIRHWFATKTYTDKSIPLPVQMAVVGHKSVATAMRYAHVTPAEVAAAAAGAAKRRTTAVRAAGRRGKVVEMGGRRDG